MPEPNTRQLAALIHELVKVESFASYGDLAEATKCRAARLRIPYDAAGVDEALRLVERSRPVLVLDADRRRRFPTNPERRFWAPLTRAEAPAALARVFDGLRS